MVVVRENAEPRLPCSLICGASALSLRYLTLIPLLLASPVLAEPGLPAGLLAMAPGTHSLVVEKSTEKLFLYESLGMRPPRLLRAWNATTGRAGGDKLVEGDLRTPEGIYFLTKVIEDRDLPALYGIRAFVLDYPNLFDSLDGKTGSGIWLHATDEPLKALSSMATTGLCRRDKS